MKKKISGWIAAILFLMNGTAFASVNYSTWAEEGILFAQTCGVLTENEATWQYTEEIKRGELVPLLLRAYENTTFKKIPKGEPNAFSDASENETAIYLLGIMNGVGDGRFSPQSPVTREQIAKIILTLQSACEETKVILPEAYYNPMTDFMAVSDWAKPYVELAYNCGIVTGYEDGSFRGNKVVTKEEAVALIVRSVSLQVESVEPPAEQAEETGYGDTLCWNVEDFYESGEITVTWNRIRGVEEYTLTVMEQRNSRIEGDIPPNDPEIYTFTDETSHTFYLYPNRTYQLTLTAGEERLTKAFYVPYLMLVEQMELANAVPQTKEEADALMEEISVPVWKMKSDGTKIASDMQVIVHSAISDRVRKVFEEIFAGEEQFPIKDMGGYAWRGGTTEHNWGTAIDLNYNENYCIYKDETTVGECWLPYENPYSVLPYGDVVNAFEKYGFTWGGDAWASTKDYMHFSYLGT